jgi:hypothetical protein
MRDRQTRDEIAAVVIAVTCLILISSVFALVGYGFCYEQWKEEAIRHGAAVYVTEDGQPVWKWKDEVQ